MSELSSERVRDLTPLLDDAFHRHSLSASDGNVEAQREMIGACRDYLLFIASHELNAAVRSKFAPSDIVQNTMVLAVEKYSDFRGDDQRALLAWLRQILIHQVRDVVRHAHAAKRDVNRERSLDPSGGGIRPEMRARDVTPSTEAVAREEAQRLHAALLTLSEDHQRVLKLRNWERLPFAEIATQMGRSETAVKKLWGRAVEALRHALR